MFFAEDHLRITKIKTVNGLTPEFDEQGRPVKKIVFAPKNRDTLRLFADQNTRLPNHLKMTIEPVKAYNPHAIHNSQQNDEAELLKLQLAALQAENEKLKSENVLKVSANGNANNSSAEDNSGAKQTGEQADGKVSTGKTSK